MDRKPIGASVCEIVSFDFTDHGLYSHIKVHSLVCDLVSAQAVRHHRLSKGTDHGVAI